MAVPAEELRYTFADYLNWDSRERAELFDGVPVMMSSPTRRHQKISMELSRQLANFLEGKQCEVYAAPFAVRLFEQDGDRPEDVNTVVEPDISVVCGKTKLDSHGCKGAPDFIIEILSPSTARLDRLVKLDLYQRAGVREYWIISPAECTVTVFLLEGGALAVQDVYGTTGPLNVHVLEGCWIDLDKVFAE